MSPPPAGLTKGGSSDHPPRAAGLLLAAVVVAVFLVAVTGVPNLLDNEGRLASYVLDALQNGNWLVQHDTLGDIASKPPLLTWLAALATLPAGRMKVFSL